MSGDVVERLRQQSRDGLMSLPDDFEMVSYAEAADLITSQAAEIERRDSVIDGLNRQLTEQFELSTKYVAKAETAERQLEEALRRAGEYGIASAKNANRAEAAEQQERRLANGIREIMRACVDGRVCNDVAWFDDIETLFDKCASILGDLLPEAEYEAIRDARTLTNGGENGR